MHLIKFLISKGNERKVRFPFQSAVPEDETHSEGAGMSLVPEKCGAGEALSVQGVGAFLRLVSPGGLSSAVKSQMPCTQKV